MYEARSKVASRQNYKKTVHSPPAIAKLSLDDAIGRIDTFKSTINIVHDSCNLTMVVIRIRNSAKHCQEAKAADQNEAMEQHRRRELRCVALQVNQSQCGEHQQTLLSATINPARGEKPVCCYLLL